MGSFWGTRALFCKYRVSFRKKALYTYMWSIKCNRSFAKGKMMPRERSFLTHFVKIWSLFDLIPTCLSEIWVIIEKKIFRFFGLDLSENLKIWKSLLHLWSTPYFTYEAHFTSLMKHTSLHLGFTPYCTHGTHLTPRRNSRAIPLRIHTLLHIEIHALFHLEFTPYST